jgi:uncharacterized membrane protein
MPDFSQPDLFALAWLTLCWVGYTVYSDRIGAKKANLIASMAEQRKAWMRQMLGRENRMLDIQILRNLTRTGAFFASTSVLVLAGLVAVLGATDKAISLVANLPFVSDLTSLQWELRLLLLVLVFSYAFFKFVWSIRQISYCAVLVGGTPPSTALDETCFARAENIARVATLAGLHFNRGVRAYYFAVAILAWFVHPLALALTCSWVVIVLHRREFRSRTLRILKECEPAG